MHPQSKRPLNARSLLLLGALALVLMAWGCGGRRMGTGALPPLPLGATLEVSELPYVVTGTTVPEIRLSLSRAATEALEGSSIDLHRSSLSLGLPVWTTGGALRDDLDQNRARIGDPGTGMDRS